MPNMGYIDMIKSSVHLYSFKILIEHFLVKYL